MPFIERNEDGAIIAVYANPQDYAKEELPDDHPEVRAFVERPYGPNLIKRHQGLIALLTGAAITEADIREKIADIADPVQREIMRIRFDQPEWERRSDFIAWGQQAFGLTDQQVDALFEAAKAV